MKCLGHLSVAACYYIVAPLFKKKLLAEVVSDCMIDKCWRDTVNSH